MVRVEPAKPTQRSSTCLEPRVLLSLIVNQHLPKDRRASAQQPAEIAESRHVMQVFRWQKHEAAHKSVVDIPVPKGRPPAYDLWQEGPRVYEHGFCHSCTTLVDTGDQVWQL